MKLQRNGPLYSNTVVGKLGTDQGSSRTRERIYPVDFFCILQLLTVIFHGSPSVIKLISLLPAFMHVNNNVYLYDIIDDTSAM